MQHKRTSRAKPGFVIGTALSKLRSGDLTPAPKQRAPKTPIFATCRTRPANAPTPPRAQG